MSFLNALTLFVILIIIYQIIVDLFTVLFRFTGLPQEIARFQVVSILTGCGFTTEESEITISTLNRRKLARRIMIFGYAFTVTVMSALVNVFLSLNQLELRTLWWQLSIPLVALIILEALSRHHVVKRYLNNSIERLGEKLIFRKVANRILVLDYRGKNTIAEVYIKKVPNTFRDILIRNSGLQENYGILVILIERSSKKTEKVHADDVIMDGDRLIVYGDYSSICKVFEADERYFGNDEQL